MTGDVAHVLESFVLFLSHLCHQETSTAQQLLVGCSKLGQSMFSSYSLPKSLRFHWH